MYLILEHLLRNSVFGLFTYVLPPVVKQNLVHDMHCIVD